MSFIPWIEDNNVNATQDYNTYLNDSQRKEGFKGGTPASAIRVNTALRQANLVATALMKALNVSETLNYRSSITDTQNAILNGIKATKVVNAEHADNADNATNAVNAQKAITQASSDNSTNIATTAFVQSASTNNINTALSNKIMLLKSGNFQLLNRNNGTDTVYSTSLNVQYNGTYFITGEIYSIGETTPGTGFNSLPLMTMFHIGSSLPTLNSTKVKQVRMMQTDPYYTAGTKWTLMSGNFRLFMFEDRLSASYTNGVQSVNTDSEVARFYGGTREEMKGFNVRITQVLFIHD